MSAAPLPPSPDEEPLDAVVIEQPAVFVVRPQDVYRPSGGFGFQRPAPAQFVVPRRFGMSGILGIMTGMAILFGCFQAYSVPPVLYLFFGVQAIVICVVQMFNRQAPRAASAISGAIILPLFLVLAGALGPRRMHGPIICELVGSLPLGVLLGYATGTLAAGVFLVMDMMERLIAGEPLEGPAGREKH